MSGRAFSIVAGSMCLLTLLAVAAIALNSMPLAMLFAVLAGVFAGSAGVWAA